MFEYFKTLGLESNTGIDPIEGEMSEIDLDIIGCESAADLVISLLDFSLESEITSLGFNKILVAETVDAGLEGDQLGTLLEQLGVGGILEDGTENAATDKIKAGWHKVKAVIGTVVNAVIAFFKKIASLWATTDKIYAKINKKATEMKEKWDKYTFGKGPEKNVETAVKNLNANINSVADTIGGAIPRIVVDAYTKKSELTLAEFVEMIANGDGLPELEKAERKERDNATNKAIKDATGDVLKDAKKKDSLTYAAYKEGSSKLLATIIASSKKLMDLKLFEKCKNAVTAMEKIKAEISKVKGDEIDKVLKGEENKQKLMKSAAYHIHTFQEYPKNMAIKAKAYASMCSLGLSEVSKCMSIAK